MQRSNPSDQTTSAAISALGGRTIELDTEAGWLEVEFTPTPSGETEPGLRTLLGGLLAEAAAATVAETGRSSTVYLKANVASERPAEALIGKARVMQTAPTVIYAEGELRTVGGKLVGSGSSMVRVAPPT